MWVAHELAAQVEDAGDAPTPREPLSLRRRFREASYDGSTGQPVWEQDQAILEQDAANRQGGSLTCISEHDTSAVSAWTGRAMKQESKGTAVLSLCDDRQGYKGEAAEPDRPGCCQQGF